MMRTMRRDLNQWLIEDEEPVTAAVRVVEMVSMILAGQILARHPTLQVRAVGNVAEGLGRTRLAVASESLENDIRLAAHHASALLQYLSVPNPLATPVGDSVLDELHAAVFWLDSTLRQMGVGSEEWYARVARGDA
jgi:hypothetical protein